MFRSLTLLHQHRRARVFLLAHVQSAIGSGAQTVAIVVLAYARYRSPWAITLVLLANFAPGMLLGPLIGAVADRCSRRWCAVGSDLLRAAAFVGIGLSSDFALMIVLTLVAGLGTSLFSPAILASLPEIVEPEWAPSATALYGSISDLGRIVGPLLAAPLFAVIGAAGLTIANGVTFAISAAVLASIRFGARPVGARARRSGLLRETREGLSVARRLPVVRVVIWSACALTLFAAMLEVPELLLAQRLGAGASGYAYLVAAWGIGLLCGSLAGSRGGDGAAKRARYLQGLGLEALGILMLSAAPSLLVAVPAFFLIGLGNGMVVVHARLLLQALVPEHLMARAFAVIDTLVYWAFAVAFVTAGALVSVLGVRTLIALAGASCLCVLAATVLGMRIDTNVARTARTAAPRPFGRYSEAPAASVSSPTAVD